MPNAIAYAMLLLWPFVVWTLFRRLDPARALIWTILGGYLVLPPVQAALQAPLVPDLNKISIPNLMALACATLMLRDRIAFVPQGRVGRALVVMFVLGPFATVLTNSDPVVGPGLYLQGMRIYDSVAVVATQAIALLPFFLARHYLATPAAIRTLIVALAVAGLIYAWPMLVEVAISPQLNTMVYGFFQHDFAQTVRFGGFRPVVFLPHGLWVALFALMALISALVMARQTSAEERTKWVAATLFLAVILVLCRSAGPLIYALVLAPLVLIVRPRLQVLIAAVLALIVITYPLLRGAHLLPLDDLVTAAARFSAQRAESLSFRLTNEDILLAHVEPRSLFGWGGYARNLVHDPQTGAVLTVSDGSWIIVLGIKGWVGYLAEFGLLVLPLLMLGRDALRRGGAPLSPFVTALALLLAVNLVDLLPNATLEPLTWLMAGALLGHAEARRAALRSEAVSALASAVPRTVL